MGILDYNSRLPAKNQGEVLYDTLLYSCERGAMSGRPVQGLLIGAQALAFMEAHLTEVNGRAMTLQEAGFAGRHDLPIWIDELNPMRLSPLAEV